MGRPAKIERQSAIQEQRAREKADLDALELRIVKAALLNPEMSNEELADRFPRTRKGIRHILQRHGVSRPAQEEHGDERRRVSRG